MEGFKHKLIIVLISISFISCKQKDDYEFQIVNETNFDIDIFEFSDEEFMIPSRGESALFTRTLVFNCTCPTEPLVNIGIREFSDSVQSYKHSSRAVISPASRSTSKTNILRIVMAESVDFPDHVFDIEVEP